MLQVKIKGKKDRRQSLVLYSLLGLIAIISFALTYVVIVPVGPENAVRSVSAERSSGNDKKAAR